MLVGTVLRPAIRMVNAAFGRLPLSSDIRIWPGGDMKNWPTFMLMQLRFRAATFFA
jgi:hypothetical protein